MHHLRVYTLFSKFTYVLNFNVYCHDVVGREWDAIHLYITNNLDWLKVWIERCKLSCHGISWEGVASSVKASHRNGDTNLTEREIDLAYGLKDKQTILLINHIFVVNQLYFCCSFPCMAA